MAVLITERTEKNMALPDFKKVVQDKKEIPPWAGKLKEGEFISYQVSYKTRAYLDLFDRYVMLDDKVGDIRYYVYDPVKHGADPDGKYPVTMWFHGLSNSLMEDGCIMCCGAEQFASPKHQSEMGSAYIIVPLCNEVREESGRVIGGWSEDHICVIKKIYDKVVSDCGKNISKKFVMGASSGGYFTWKMLESFPDFFDGAIPISSGYVPDDKSLDKIERSGVSLLIAHGRNDEMAVFDECILPYAKKLQSMKNCICFFPEWVYNGDGGISSVFYGFEMGQHCMINWIQHNLIFDDGRYADVRLPKGVTGWIKSVCGG